MMDIEKLRKELESGTLLVANELGHNMNGFSPDHETPAKSRAYCRNCGAGIYIDASTKFMSGEAIRDKCRNA